MTLYANYNAWIAGIRELLDVDSTEYPDTKIGEFLHNGELTLNRNIRSRHMEDYASTTIPSDTQGHISLPSDYLQSRGVYHHTSGIAIESASPDDFFKRVAMGGTDDTYPEMYMVVGDEMHFMPYGLSNEITLIYYKKIPHLTATTVESNAFTEHYPDALLYASALAAGPYMIDDIRIPIWREELKRILVDVNKEQQSEQYGSSPVKRRLRVFG